MAQALVLVRGSDDIMKNIKSIEAKGKALDALIHVTAVSILAHIHEHREVSLANKLLAAMPRSARRNALIEWFCTFGEMDWNEKGKVVVFAKDAATNMVKAEFLPFWEFKPEAAYHPLDLFADIKKLITSAEKRLKDIDAEKAKDPLYESPDKIDAAALASLKALLPAMC